MSSQIACQNRCIVALVAFVQFFLDQVFKRALKLPTRKDTVVVVTFIRFLSRVSFQMSNHLPEQMHSRNGCICTIFLQSEFSNVFSNCLPAQMHCRIGCICMTFSQCDFSNVFSNCSSDQMHSRISCICMTFIQCEFSNGFSNCVP